MATRNGSVSALLFALALLATGGCATTSESQTLFMSEAHLGEGGSLAISADGQVTVREHDLVVTRGSREFVLYDVRVKTDLVLTQITRFDDGIAFDLPECERHFCWRENGLELSGPEEWEALGRVKKAK